MLAKATAKIKAEMEKSKQDGYVQYVGGFLLEYLAANPQDANKLSADGKTIAGSLDEMRKVAEKKKVGKCAMLTPQEGLAVVLKYYGIEAAPSFIVPSVDLKPQLPKMPMSRPEVDFDVNLDDLL